jgi:hypothetical protein
MANDGSTDWRMSGDEVSSCNCVWACPCQFEGPPSDGHCETIIGYEVREGHFGDTQLDGVRFAWLVHWPGAIHEGNGTRQVIVDEGAGDAQREAIEALSSGEHGGPYFEIFASVCPNQRETLTAAIEIESDLERRKASMRIGDIAESRIEPIRNPVDDSEHRVRIDLPDGFEYKIAEIANTVSATSNADAPLGMTLENSYGQLNEFDWAPA